MGAKQRAEGFGLKPLKLMYTGTGLSRSAVNNWYRNRPEAFDLLAIGCKVKQVMGDDLDKLEDILKFYLDLKKINDDNKEEHF